MAVEALVEAKAAGGVTRPFGQTREGVSVEAFVLTQVGGMSAEFITLGAALTSLQVPVGGALRQLVLGCDSVADYEAQGAYLGSVVGRCANRTGFGRLHLGGEVHQLDLNHGEHHLHGGASGLSQRVWSGRLIEDARGPSVRFEWRSFDGEGGYPGNLDVRVDYTLDREGGLWMEYSATTDATTAVNLTHHAYFNLGGAGGSDCADHRVRVIADRVLETDVSRIPTGRLVSVKGTPLDLRSERRLGDGLSSEHPWIVQGSGYDHALVFPEGRGLREVAQVSAPDGQVVMTLSTDQPSLQLYTGNFLSGTPARGGGVYQDRAGLCLEAQGLIDATKHAHFPSVVLRPQERYQHRTCYRFEAKGRS